MQATHSTPRARARTVGDERLACGDDAALTKEVDHGDVDRALGASRERVLSAARTGRHREALLAHATAGRIVAGWTLDPAPRDPATHVEATHARTRRHLERLLEKPAGAEVRSPMTSQLYTRLTQPADPSRRARIDYTVVESYTYTPR